LIGALVIDFSVLVPRCLASGWTEAQAVLNKAQVWVFEALQDWTCREKVIGDPVQARPLVAPES
jgi:hypothetical protein